MFNNKQFRFPTTLTTTIFVILWVCYTIKTMTGCTYVEPLTCEQLVTGTRSVEYTRLSGDCGEPIFKELTIDGTGSFVPDGRCSATSERLFGSCDTRLYLTCSTNGFEHELSGDFSDTGSDRLTYVVCDRTSCCTSVFSARW